MPVFLLTVRKGREEEKTRVQFLDYYKHNLQNSHLLLPKVPKEYWVWGAQKMIIEKNLLISTNFRILSFKVISLTKRSWTEESSKCLFPYLSSERWLKIQRTCSEPNRLNEHFIKSNWRNSACGFLSPISLKRLSWIMQRADKLCIKFVKELIMVQ